MKKMNKKLKRWIIGLFLLYMTFGVIMYVFQERFIFQSSTLAEGYRFNFGIPVQEYDLELSNGNINMIHFKVDSSKGCILYFHGNAGDLSKWGEVVKPLLTLGYDIMLMDYRGYGKSKGERIEKEMYQDAIMAYEKAKEYFKEEEIIVYGRSLGSTFATWVAANHSPKKLILETPFYSLKSVVKGKFPYLPVDQMLEYNFDTHKFYSNVKCPIVFFHGNEDGVVSYNNGQRLFARSKNARFVTFPRGGHNDLMRFQLYWENMKREFK